LKFVAYFSDRYFLRKQFVYGVTLPFELQLSSACTKCFNIQTSVFCLRRFFIRFICMQKKNSNYFLTRYCLAGLFNADAMCVYGGEKLLLLLLLLLLLINNIGHQSVRYKLWLLNKISTSNIEEKPIC